MTLTILYHVVHLKMEVKDWYIQFFIPPSLGTVHGPGHKDKCIETYLRQHNSTLQVHYVHHIPLIPEIEGVP